MWETLVSTSCISAENLQIGGAWDQWNESSETCRAKEAYSVQLYEQSGLILQETLGTLRTFRVTLIWKRNWQRKITAEMQAQHQICKFKKEEPIWNWPAWFLWMSKPTHVPNYIPLFPCSALTFSKMQTTRKDVFINLSSHSKQQQKNLVCTKETSNKHLISYFTTLH